MGSETGPESKACPLAPTAGKKQMLTADGRWLLGEPQPLCQPPGALGRGVPPLSGDSGPTTHSIALGLHNSQVPCQTPSIPRFSKSVTRSNGRKDATKHLKRCQTQDQPRTQRLQAHHASARWLCYPLWLKGPSQVHIPVPRGAKPFSTLPCLKARIPGKDD